MRWGLYLQIRILRVREVICWRPQSRYAAESHPLHTSYHGPVAEKKEIIWIRKWHSKPKGDVIASSNRSWNCPQVRELLAHYPSAIGDSTGHQDWGLQGARLWTSAVTSHFPEIITEALLLCFSSHQFWPWHPATNVILWHLRALCETKFRWQDEGLLPSCCYLEEICFASFLWD